MADLFTLGVELDTKGVKRGEKDLDNLSKAAGKAEKSTKKLGDASEKTSKKSDAMSRSIKAASAALAAYVTIDAAAAVLGTADSFQLLNDRIRLATDATGDYVAVQQRLYALSQSTGTALSGNVDLFQRIQIGAQELGRSNTEILQLVDSLSKLGTLGGSSSNELSNATVQLAQGLAGGIIRAEEFNSILENTPKIAQSIANGLGVSVGELRAMMLEGELLADDVFNSILSQTKQINEQFDQMPDRIGRSGTALSNAWMNTVGLFDDAIGASSAVAGWMDAIAEKLDERVAFWREELDLVEQMEIQVASLESAYRGLGRAQLESRKATLERMFTDLERQVAEVENRIFALPMDDVIRNNFKAVKSELAQVDLQLKEMDGKKSKVEIEVEVKAKDKKIPDIFDTDAGFKFVDDAFVGYIENNLTPELSAALGVAFKEGAEEGLEDGLKNTPSDFAMSIGNALASQDYSSFGNILAGQAASSIGTAVTDAIGGSLGGVAGGLIGGAAGAVISQAISSYLADDLIAQERQARQGTGTVLGSIDEKSASIANSMGYMTDALDDLIGVNTSGFRSMQALVNSLSGASNLVARDFNAEGIADGLGLSGLGGITQDFGGIVDDFFGGLTGGLFEGVFGSIGGALFGKSSVSDEGIRLLGGTIAEMIDNDVAQAYQTVTKKSLFGSSRSDNFRFAGDAIEQQFDLTLEAMRDAVVSSAEQLNMLPSEIQANLDAFTVEATRISIKDLSASEVANELNAVFSSILDGMASAVVPFVDDFQRSGEGAGETLSRLSTNLSVVDEMLSQLRLSDLQGTTQQMLMLSEGIVDFFGDASGLATAFTGFVSEFATQERQLEILTDGLTRALGEQDVAILNSRDGVYDYIASLERLDDGNADRIANILSLSGSLDDYFNLLEAVNEELISSALDPAMASLNRAIDSERDQVRDSYETQREAAQNLLETLNEGFGDLEKVADSLENAISSTVSMSAEAARSQLQSARNQIAAFADSGIIPDSDELNKLLSIVTGDNAKYYATAADYYREQGRTANDIAFLSEIADEQLSEAEQQIKAQEGILEQLEKQYQLDLDYLDSLLEAYQNEYDALMGIDVSILSVADAVARVEAAINNLELISGGSGGSGVSSSEISSAYDYLQQQNTSSGMTDWDATDYQTGLAAINAGISSQELADSLGVSASYVQQRAEELGLPAFANGGTFSQGGLALVGERGPEIVNMPSGTHVSTAQQTGSLMDNSQLVGLVQELIDKTIVQNGYAKKSYDILNQVSTGGKTFRTDSVIVKTL